MDLLVSNQSSTKELCSIPHLFGLQSSSRCLIVPACFSGGLDKTLLAREDNAQMRYLVFPRRHHGPFKLNLPSGADNLSADHGSWPVILAVAPNGIVDEAVI